MTYTYLGMLQTLFPGLPIIKLIYKYSAVTGSSSGFGRAITEAASRKGDQVIATLRRPSDLDDLVASTPSSQLLVFQCDVSSESDIQNAFAQGASQFGSIDIVFNNAGFAILGEAESTPNDVAGRLFDVNFLGAANVSREAVRVFREINGSNKGGWLFNVSSAAGVLGFSACSYYCARYVLPCCLLANFSRIYQCFCFFSAANLVRFD